MTHFVQKMLFIILKRGITSFLVDRFIGLFFPLFSSILLYPESLLEQIAYKNS